MTPPPGGTKQYAPVALKRPEIPEWLFSAFRWIIKYRPLRWVFTTRLFCDECLEMREDELQVTCVRCNENDRSGRSANEASKGGPSHIPSSTAADEPGKALGPETGMAGPVRREAP
jgi:hypothetical protein